jgi:flagellar operon protein
MSGPIHLSDPIHLDPTNPVQIASATRKKQTTPAITNRVSFEEVLEKAQDVKFSNHAQKRLETRNIALSEDGLARLAIAVDKADQRGGRESLILMDDMAFIVNVRNRMVVTALDEHSRREGVFTQIDTVVFANSNEA